LALLPCYLPARRAQRVELRVCLWFRGDALVQRQAAPVNPFV
jgi:hypothetical protein